MKTKLIAFLAVMLLFVMSGVACGSSGDTTHTHIPNKAVEENRAGETCATDGSYEIVVYCSGCNAEISREKKTIYGGHVYIGNSCGRCLIERDEEYIYFGEYPQTIKADSVTITSTVDSRGYYLGSDGAYYAKVIANPYKSGYVFSDGSRVLEAAVYYFKVEPIRWRILTEGDGKALILCDSIIAEMQYCKGYSNNYKNSNVREWLNNEFYKTAFSELQKAIILTTLVDNSAESAGFSKSLNDCEDTADKIFLPSYSEITNDAYGFFSDNGGDGARERITSDYLRAIGGYMRASGFDVGKAEWWLRSPYGGTESARFVSVNGNVEDGTKVYYSLGVVPALWIIL